MSRPTNLFFVLVIAMLACVPLALADDSQSNNANMQDSPGSTQIQHNEKNTYNEHAFYDVKEHINAPTINYNTFEAQKAPVNINHLSVGTAYETVMLEPEDVYIYQIPPTGNRTFMILSGSPVAVYTLDSVDRERVLDPDSELVFEKQYGRFVHGLTVPIDLYPRYTTRCFLKASEDATYIIVDNRKFDENTMIEVAYD